MQFFVCLFCFCYCSSLIEIWILICKHSFRVCVTLLTLPLVFTDPFPLLLFFFFFLRAQEKLSNWEIPVFFYPFWLRSKAKIIRMGSWKKKNVLFSYFHFMEREFSSVKLTSEWFIHSTFIICPIETVLVSFPICLCGFFCRSKCRKEVLLEIGKYDTESQKNGDDKDTGTICTATLNSFFCFINAGFQFGMC